MKNKKKGIRKLFWRSKVFVGLKHDKLSRSVYLTKSELALEMEYFQDHFWTDRVLCESTFFLHFSQICLWQFTFVINSLKGPWNTAVLHFHYYRTWSLFILTRNKKCNNVTIVYFVVKRTECIWNWNSHWRACKKIV